MQPSHPQALGLWMGCRKYQADSCSVYMYKPTVATTYDSQNFPPYKKGCNKKCECEKRESPAIYDVTVGDPQANAA